MKNNIKKAPVKFRDDLLYFQHFCADFCLCPKSVIITTLSIISDTDMNFYNIYILLDLWIAGKFYLDH